MSNEILLDVVIRVKDEKLFKMLFDAEVNYHNVVFPFLQMWQIKGKVLKIMGIDSGMVEIKKVVKSIPFSYQRKIEKPKEKWKRRFIYLNFKPVMMHAKKSKCLKIISDGEYIVASRSKKQEHTTSRIILGKKNFSENVSTEQKKNSVIPSHERSTKIEENDSSITGNSTISQQREKRCELPQKENTPQKNSRKISASIVTIDWPLIERRPASKISNNKIAGLRISPLKNKIYTQTDFENLKENTDPRNAKNHSVFNFDESNIHSMTCDNKDNEDTHSLPQEITSSEYTNSGSGALADLFSPRKRLQRRHGTPILRINESSSSSA